MQPGILYQMIYKYKLIGFKEIRRPETGDFFSGLI